ncbi:lipase family protein [Rhodococcus sp. X156]|uniref:lipase family protein n=1 Tax=Rhodococcus sp. X156 TaxID=2499145 RepID=UPI0013E2EB47|nr:lipase family protein [Rhodococcus sp. X156]
MAIAVAAVTTTVVAPPAAVAAPMVPTPVADPFFAAPANLAALAPGEVIRSRPVTIQLYSYPVSGYQLVYRSNDSQQNPIAAATTVLLPADNGPRRVVSFQAIINSISPDCAPSQTLPTRRFGEEFHLALLLLLGYTVTVPDHEGPNAAYGAGRLSGQVVLDGARAVRGFTPLGIVGPDTPFGLWGYSGGGQATAWAAQLHGAYAPDLNIVGSAEGGVSYDLNDIARRNDGSGASGLLLRSTIGLGREYPDAGIEDLLNAEGQKVRDQLATACGDSTNWIGANRRIDELTVTPNALGTPGVQNALADNTLGGSPPKSPVLIYHAFIDIPVPTEGADRLVGLYCAQGAVVESQRIPWPDHGLLAILGIPSALGFLGARFGGAPPVNVC